MTRTWLRVKNVRHFHVRVMGCARMAELADAPDSKSGSRKSVGVQPSLWAPLTVVAGQDIVNVFSEAVNCPIVLQSMLNCSRLCLLTCLNWWPIVRAVAVMKQYKPDHVGPILFVRHFTSFSNLTKEAAHA